MASFEFPRTSMEIRLWKFIRGNLFMEIRLWKFVRVNSSVEAKQTLRLIPHLTDWLFKWLLARHEDVSDLASVTFGRRFYE